MAIGELRKLKQSIGVAFDVGVVTGLTDCQLLERFVARDDPGAELAFAALVQRHGPMVMRVCRCTLRNHQDAQDAFQATFLILSQKADRVWVRDSVGPWLHGVACRVAACSRAAATRRRIHERAAAALTPPHSSNRDVDNELKAILHEELRGLPERYRVPIVLCDLEGQTYEFVARQLGCPIGTVKSRLARGRTRLRNRIVRLRGAGLTLGALVGALSGEAAHASVAPNLVDATAQLATRLHSGATAIKLVPVAIAGLTEGVLRMNLLSRLKWAATTLVLGCGLFSASVFCFGPGSRADAPLTFQDTDEANEKEPPLVSRSIPGSTPPADEPGKLPPQPDPWETVVRMKIHRKQSVGMGSGTIIHSTPEESIVLTAAHYFKLGDEGKTMSGFEPAPVGTAKRTRVLSSIDESNFLEQYDKELLASSREGELPAAKFPFTISIDLFDGNLTGAKPAHVQFLESVAGELLDCNFSRDVALVRIRPGRRLASSRVVPMNWRPQAGMRVVTVGCSDGNDATAWHTTITNTLFHGLAGNPDYEAIECMTAPKQGRSGGGLFTSDGFLAAVCNYSEPQGNHGLYATPGSIYRLLDRNGFTFVYKNPQVVKHELDESCAALEREIAAMQARIEKDRARLIRLRGLRRQAAASSLLPPPLGESPE